MKLSLFPYQLEFKYPFRIAHGIRTHTDVVYVKLEHEGFICWGEASLPPYLKETQQSVITFLQNFEKAVSSNNINDWIEKLKSEKNNMPAKAALDMTLWQLRAQLENKSIGQLLNIEETNNTHANCFYTIGACEKNEMAIKIKDGLSYSFELFKLKLKGTKEDYNIVNDFVSFCDKPFGVDMNCAYTDVTEAADFIDFVKAKGAFVIEQPMAKQMLVETKVLKEKTKTVLYADESCQRLNDLEKAAECFGGVNIKLMKCGGITEAHQMLLRAKELGFKTLIGCMSESSVGCTAAAQLAPLADWLDLDGPYLISNNPFKGIKIKEGKLALYPLQQIQNLT